MTKTYVLSTLSSNTTHQLALLLGDTSTEAGRYLWEDEELDQFLALEGSDLYSAAATACRSAASSRAKIALAMQILGSSFQVDRTKVADVFRAMAKEWQEKATKMTPATASVQWTDGDDTMVKNWTDWFTHDFEDAVIPPDA